jgi:ATP-binding cassette, subfamily B, bacterial IrtA/YbtP
MSVETAARRSAGLSLVRSVRVALVAAVGVQAVASVAEVVPLVAVAQLARALLAADPSHGRAWGWVIAAAVAVAARIVLASAALAVSHIAENNLQGVIRRALVERLGRVPLGWFAGRGSGAVKQAVVDDVDAVHHLVAHSALELVAAVVTPLACLGYLFTVDWRMALIVLAPLLAGIALFRRVGRLFQRGFGQMFPRMRRINDTAVEFAQGIAVVKTFGQSRRAFGQFAEAADDFAGAFRSFISSLVTPRAVSELVLSPAMVAAVAVAAAAAFVTQGWLSGPDALAFLVLAPGLGGPVLAMSYAEQELRAGRAAEQRIGELLATPDAPRPAASAVPADAGVRLEDVSYSYDGDHPVLREVTLALAPGTVTALVGPSGAGKSTLAALIPRLFDPTAGRILLGGADLRDIADQDLSRHVGVVFQQVQLLRASVRDNIRLTAPDATDAEVESAARAAQVHDRITALARGYGSVIGEDAVLSGGERQRVSIARALLADAPVLVLDEAASFADPDSEVAVQAAIAELCRGRTVLVIAHRLRSIAGADQIVVLDGGRVVEAGRHHELLSHGGLYAQLWNAGQHPPGGQGGHRPAAQGAGQPAGKELS